MIDMDTGVSGMKKIRECKGMPTLYNRYYVRNRWLVDNSQRGVFVWNGDSKGTQAGYNYAVQRGKEAHLAIG